MSPWTCSSSSVPTSLPSDLPAKAHHIVTLPLAQVPPAVIADIRGRIPRHVAVVGQQAADVAVKLRQAGLPTELHTDEDVSARKDLAGIEVVPLTDRGPAMELVDSLLDLVGNTPMVRLDRMGRDLPCPLLAKLEFLNPGGSVKDRPAVAMIEAAERARPARSPGSTIVEGTSGNTGVGLAIVAARRRYRCIFVMPDKMAPEKIALLRAYGAEVVVCPTAVAPDHPDSYYSVTARLAEEIPGAFHPDQYHNPENPAVHERTTGPEIWRQTAGRVTHFVAGIGTGGTISGIGRYLKSQNPDVQIVGADPEGSVYSGGSGRPYLVEGIGEDFWPTTYDPSVVDRVVMVSDTDSFLTARRMAVDEGILVGGSTGTAVWAALQLAPDLAPRRRGRRAHPRLGPRLPVEAVQRRVDGRSRLPAVERAYGGRGARAQERRSPGPHPRAPERDGPPGDRRHAASSACPRSRSSRPNRRSPPPRSSVRSTSAT